MPWQAPTLTVKWGAYFPPDPAEEQMIVSTTMEALGSKGGTPIITLRTAVEKVASIYGTENIEAALDALTKEHEENAQRELDATKQSLAAEADAQRSIQAGKGGPPGAGGGSGRPPSGKVNAGPGAGGKQ